jgi:acetyl-CoA carboxylase carboxyl transferase subunit alpha
VAAPVSPAAEPGTPVAAAPAADTETPASASPRVLAPPDASDAAAAQEAVWARVRAARNVKRPHTLELIRAMATDVVELHGDRLFRDDPAVAGGLARVGGRRIVFVGHQKGSETDENVRRNFGMAHPEGYRKAMRLFALAERFGLAIVTIVDTPGAHPDAESEERGIAEAIARAIMEMSGLRTPVVTVITGEGGSGGALGIAVGDVVLALENAVYAVISPEGCASILWRDASVAPRAAVAMRMTAAEQLALGVVDEVVPEPAGGAQDDPAGMAAALGRRIAVHIDVLRTLSPDELLDRRYARYRAMGAFRAAEPEAAPPARKPDLAGRLRGLVGAGIEAGRAALGAQDGQATGGRAASPVDAGEAADLDGVDAPLRSEP